MKPLPLAALLFVAAISATAQAQSSGPLDVAGNWKVGWTLPGSIPVRGYTPLLNFSQVSFSQAGQSLKVSGKVGCNFINGPVTLNGDQLSFGVLVSTRVACSVAVGQQETTLIKALSGQTLTAVRVADSLTLTTKGGSELNIRRSTLQGK
ncbi:META domain-containing protein [Deinococcus puniceus]|uniref:META domain-containing protein n=1 Tax=Deinococcus puniceus TaxID=1182568 RepID=UPI0007C8EDD4|nr:META domain-containing protein [Deinococcus puniceus]